MSRLPLLAGVAAVAWLAGAAPAADEPKPPTLKLLTVKVARGKLRPQVIERGSVESADNRDIYCRVKAGSKNSTIATTIKWVVEDGSVVKKGQLLVELDDSGLVEQLKAQKLLLDKAEAEKVQAEEQFKITLSQNESDIKSAETVLQLARIDLEKYQKGDLERAQQDIKIRLLLAEADAEQAKETLEQAEGKLKRKQGTEAQVRIARLRLEAAQLSLGKARAELQVFEKYSRQRAEVDLGGKVAEAQKALERVAQQAKAREVKDGTDRNDRRSLYEQAKQQYADVEEEIRKCKILAPQDGMVLYYVPEQSRFGSGAQQSIVAQGEPVREGQKLMQIPDLSRMQVVLRVPEALVSQVRRGMPAVVRVDAFPGRVLRGTVRQIATIPTMRDWLASDEKVYPTVITIDGDVSGLRPSMSATGSVDLGKAVEDVLTVPARAVLGRGRTASCLVLTADGPEEREVGVGLRNEEVAEITSGLREGDEVIVNPRLLLNDLRDRLRFLRSRPGPRN